MILTRVTYDATVDRLMSVCSFRIRANLPDLAVKADVDIDNDTHWPSSGLLPWGKLTTRLRRLIAQSEKRAP